MLKHLIDPDETLWSPLWPIELKPKNNREAMEPFMTNRVKPKNNREAMNS